jgi:hypothetical protein
VLLGDSSLSSTSLGHPSFVNHVSRKNLSLIKEVRAPNVI